MTSKYKQVKVSLKIDDHIKLQEHCRENGVTMASFFRDLVNYEIEDIRKPRSKRETKIADPKLLYHLNKIGNNLNQIAKNLHQKRELDFKVLFQLVEIEKRIKKLLK